MCLHCRNIGFCIEKVLSITWIWCCLLCAFSWAQEPVSNYADSLLRLAEGAKTDSAKTDHYFQLSYYWSERDTSKAFAYLEKAKQYMPDKGGYYQGLLHFYIAGIYFDEDAERAKKEYMLAEKQLEPYHTPEAYRYRARLWNNYGVLFQANDQEDTYVGILLEKAIPLARQSGDSVLVAENYHNVGMVLMNITNYKEAAEYYKKALHTLSSSPRAHEEKFFAYVNAAKNAIYMRRFPMARHYLDSARIQCAIIPHSVSVPIYYRTEGNYFRHQKQPQKALTYFEKGIKAAEDLGNDFAISDILFEKYALYRDMGDYRTAKIVLLQSSKYFHGQSNISNRRLNFRELAETDAKLGNYREAFEWLNKYTSLSDSVYEADMAMNIMELEKKYKAVEKENEILLLKDENQQQQLALGKNRFLITVLMAGLLITVLLFFIGWNLYKGKQKTIDQNQRLHQQELKNIQQQEQIKLYNAVLQGQEQERNRIARDLHDGLGGMLAGVKLKLSSIASREYGKVKQPDMEIYKIINQLDHSVDELRRIARNMMPESLLYMGLEPALRDLCKSLHSERTSVKFQAFDLRSTYNQALLITVYRIVQELLTNAVKHAKAANIVVQCSENEDHLYITVEDDGIGFDMEKAHQGKGIGLSNIENRVSILEGTVEIDSKLGEGTTFNIDIPLYGK